MKIKSLLTGICYTVMFLGLFSLQACKNAPKERHYRLGFSQCTGEDNWRKSMLEDMKRELSFHPGTELIYKDAQDNSHLQAAQVEELLKQDIDLLIISANEAKPLTSVVEQAYTKGIPVILIDRKTSSPLYTGFVGADNTEIGRMAGQYISKRLHGKGNIININGRAGSSPAIERQTGLLQSLKNAPDIHVLADIYGNWLKNDAFSELMKIKDKLANADAVFAQNDLMALGAYEVYQKLGISKKIWFVGVDGLAAPGGGLQLVNDKIIDATLSYPTGGVEAIQTAFKLLEGEPFNKENLLQTFIIDSSNVKPLIAQTEKIKTQQIDIEKQQVLLDKQHRIYKHQLTLINIFIIALGLVLVLAFIAYSMMRKNRRINKKLALKNIEISRQRDKLVEMTAKTKALTEAKFNFFTGISHEFRTPLTLILGPLEDVLASPKLHFSIKNNLELVQKNVFRLLRLVNELIGFRKVEYEKMRLRASENDIVSYIREITEVFQAMAKKRSIILRLHSDVADLKVWFDPNVLDKVFFNLLSNALKFTGNQGIISINIRTACETKVCIIEIKDSGVGMSAEERAHAFELFYQGQNLSTPQQGSGLGLALCREFIALHHGSISLQSEKGQGCCFTINLPLDNIHLKPEEILVQKSQLPILNKEDIKIYTSDFSLEQTVNGTLIDQCRSHDYSVLIIEDNDDLRSFLRYKLENSYDVYEAAAGDAGLAMVYEVVPDLIVCDLALPGNNGLEIIKTLKQDVRASHIPIIILTANSAIEKQVEGMKLTADAFISKPFSAEYLQETIHSLLRNRQLLKKHYTTEVPSDIPRENLTRKTDLQFISGFKACIEKNIDNENLTVEYLSKEIGISRVQLYRKTKALLGVNVNEYILIARLQKSKYLLLNENLSIGEIAYKVGFSSQAYFSTVFKSKIGVSPKQFKEGIVQKTTN